VSVVIENLDAATHNTPLPLPQRATRMRTPPKARARAAQMRNTRFFFGE
jgi:hypothetical protein